MYHWKKVVLVLISIIILVWLFLYLKKREVSYTPTVYEEELISYFKEIALQSEYDDNPQKVIKWQKPMILFVIIDGEYENQMSAIKKTIYEINRLATDGFKIEITNNISKSNSILFLCTKEKVAELNPYFYNLLTDDIDYEISGLAYSEFMTKKYIINKSLIFINSEFSIDIQESTILEEITQSLGLAFDSKTYSNSIFYQNKSQEEVTINEYSEMDRDIVRLLYHPKIKPGMNSTEIEKEIKRILKSEKE